MAKPNFIPRPGVYSNKHDTYDTDHSSFKLKWNQIEVQVGEIVKMGKSSYRVEEAERRGNCYGCDLYKEGVCWKTTHHNCSAYSRTDKTWVVFKKV